MEIWKFVAGYEDLFLVSSYGRIFSVRTEKELVRCVSKNGYYVISSKIGGRKGKSICLKVHRLVADAFIDNDNMKPFINHIDGDKLNNNLHNLEWCTHKENMEHANRTGLIDRTTNFGSYNESSKLTEIDALKIRLFFKERHRVYGARAMAKSYGVNHKQIMRVINREAFKHC